MAGGEKWQSRLFKEQHHKFSPKLWTNTYLTQNTSNKALINFEDSTHNRRRKKYNTRWADLPDLLLERIFSYLSIRERYYASIVCSSWNRVFYFPYVWSQFVLEDNTLTRARFNYYQGWQYVLDHLRTQMCLTQVGCNFRKLTFEPMLNFFNLYEFMNMVSWYCEQATAKTPAVPELGIGSKIKTLKFTFPCNMDNRDEDMLFGTGGRLLGSLKRLMTNLPSLRRLELIDLMLEVKEAEHLLDGVCDMFCLSLKTLILVNTTKIHYPLLHVGVFLNLEVLVISPQNLGNDVIDLIAHTNLKHLHIYQNRYTPDFVINMVNKKAWKNCLKHNPNIAVHLELECVKEKRQVWPEGAPVRSILYDSPNLGVQLHEIILAVENYKSCLLVYGHKNMPRGYRPRAFQERVDEPLMLLCRQAHKLHTLVITERISTSTILLIATTCKNLKQLYVRRNAVIKKCDWAYNPNWSDAFYQWLKATSRSYESVEQEVSQILGFKWIMLPDRIFKSLHVDLHNLY